MYWAEASPATKIRAEVAMFVRKGRRRRRELYAERTMGGWLWLFWRGEVEEGSERETHRRGHAKEERKGRNEEGL